MLTPFVNLSTQSDSAISREDDECSFRPRSALKRNGIEGSRFARFVDGDDVRDWALLVDN